MSYLPGPGDCMSLKQFGLVKFSVTSSHFEVLVTSASTLAATAVAIASSSLATTRKLKKLSLPCRLQQHRRSIPTKKCDKNITINDFVSLSAYKKLKLKILTGTKGGINVLVIGRSWDG